MKNIHVVNQNIYITSDEEIKEGDWLIIIDDFETYVHEHKGDNLPTTYHKKIILTTDVDLIKDGVQEIDDEFLEWFVQNPDCEEVEVNDWLDDKGNIAFNGKLRYQIIIPSSEILCKYCLSTTTCCDDVEAETCENYPTEEPKQETRKNRLLEELIKSIKNKQSFLKSIKKNPQLYYYKLGSCIYERLYNNNNCFEMQDSYGGQSSKMEQELISLKAEKIYYE